MVQTAMCEDYEEDDNQNMKVAALKKVRNSEAVGALNIAFK